MGFYTPRNQKIRKNVQQGIKSYATDFQIVDFQIIIIIFLSTKKSITWGFTPHERKNVQQGIKPCATDFKIFVFKLLQLFSYQQKKQKINNVGFYTPRTQNNQKLTLKFQPKWQFR